MSKTEKNNNPKLIATNLHRNFIWNTIGSTAAAFISLFLMMAVTRINGIDDAGIFSFAFSLAATFLVIGVYSGRTFQVTDKNKKTTDSDYFSLKLITCCAMLGFGLAFCTARGYSGDKFLIIMLLIVFRILEASAESIYAVIQKQERLYQVGQSLFIKAILSLLGFIIVDCLTHSIVLSCIAMIMTHILIIAFFDLPRLRKTGFHFEGFRLERVLYLFRIGFYTFGFTILSFYVVNASRYALDSTASSSAQTIYGIIAMPATVLSLIGQYFVQPFLTNLKKFFATDICKFRNLVIKLCFAVLGIGLICILTAWLLGIPVLELLYAIELDGNLLGLILIITGGIFNALVLVISTALVTMRRTGNQFWVYCITSLAALFISKSFVASNGVLGACISYMISMMLLLVLYVGVFAYHLRALRINPDKEIQHATHE